MQSLKIIIFRDTDKPYTMIISSGVLVGIAFSLIALMSFLTFSVMSNVMFYGDGQQESVMLASTNEQGEDSQPADDVTSEQSVDESKPEDSGEIPANEPSADDDGDNAIEEGTTVPVEEQSETTTETTENVPDSTESNERMPETGTQTSVTPYMPADSEVEAFLLQDAQFGSNSIRVRAQVQKRMNLGERYRGRFCAALVDAEGNIGPTYPNQVNIEGLEVINPERANTFRIGYRRNYDIHFTDVDPQVYTGIVFYLFDEETKTLQWRNAVPLTR